MPNQESISTDVLIVGGGPVGLALAVELGQRGVACMVAEEQERIGRQPRAKTTNVRSMEFFRRWGLAGAVRDAAPLPADYPSNIVFATRLFGPRLTTIHNAFYATQARNELFSEYAQWIPQYKIESVLREAAGALPSVKLRFGLRFTGLSQDEQGVTAELQNADGSRMAIRAQYLIGADGPRSPTRAAIGSRMKGQGAYALNFNIIARIRGMEELLAREPAVMYWLVNPDAPGFTGPMDVDDTWFFGCVAESGQAEMSDEEARDWINRAFGRDMQPEILQIDLWNAMALTAESYSLGRVFLAGDACQLRPPFGGYGMNLGLGDAVDLGWKLAACLQGWGGPGLLDSYQAERKPVHERFVAESVFNYDHVAHRLLRDGLEDPGEAGKAARQALGEEIARVKPREFHTLGVVKGYGYGDSRIVVPDGTPEPEPIVDPLIPSARPGAIAPHAWLADGSSLYDLFGPGFTLLVTEGAEDGAALAAEAARLGMPITVATPDDARLRALYGARLALIRPDQHVAWRGDSLPDDTAGLLAQVTGR